MDNLGGRPRTLTDSKQEQLLNHVGQGATVAEAAELVGVSLRTVQREAKDNEPFGNDLQQALGSAPSDPYQLMLAAARTHWRAAAWMLDRSDPDRFGKRPPNCCRPEQMRDLASSLIEAALQFASPEQRELLDRSLQAVADRALEAILPSQRKSGLAIHRPTPLPNEVHQRPAACSPRGEEEVLSPKMCLATKPETTEPAVAVPPPAIPAPDEVLSLEMQETTESVTAPSAAKALPHRARLRNSKALKQIEQNQARRARRQAARAKRKARKAA
jgi:hypothetical protein